MRLICPSCGATHSVEAWANDPEAREALSIAAGLPRDVARWALPYIALFRPKKRALTWKRARRLLEELQDLVAAPEVQWNNKPPRSNLHSAWARALEQISSHPPKRLPLESHNYLRAIQYGIADELDARAESSREADINRRRREEMEHFTPEEIEENKRRLAELRKTIG
jgi:hypothetical protein